MVHAPSALPRLSLKGVPKHSPEHGRRYKSGESILKGSILPSIQGSQGLPNPRDRKGANLFYLPLAPGGSKKTLNFTKRYLTYVLDSSLLLVDVGGPRRFGVTQQQLGIRRGMNRAQRGLVGPRCGPLAVEPGSISIERCSSSRTLYIL